MSLRRLVTEPLLHFFVLGAGLFILFGWINKDSVRSTEVVVVDRALVNNLEAQFERVWQRPPTPRELGGLIDSWTREEILYREGLALGLDLNDSVVRRRIAQKMSFIAEGSVPPEPKDSILMEWLADNQAQYRIKPVYTLQQVYFDPVRRGADLGQNLATLVDRLGNTGEVPEGDATLLPARLESSRESELERVFGADFARALAELSVGQWQGPVASAYGLHLVRIDRVTPGRDATLEEVRAAVERDWMAAQQEATNEAFYQAIRSRYTVRRDPEIAGAADSGTPVDQ